MTKRFLSFSGVIALLLFSSKATAQGTISYTTISNAAEIPKLEVSVYPFDFRGRGMNFGASASVFMRPVSNINIIGEVASMLYVNDYRMNYKGTDKSAVKSIGGISAVAMGEFIWMKRGVVVKQKGGAPTGKWILSQSSRTNATGTTTTTKYIPYGFNRLVERSLRGGVVYDNFPLAYNTSGQVSLALGIGKKYNENAELEINGVRQKQGHRRGYSFDILIGKPFYEDPTIGGGSNFGFRYILELHQRFTRTKDVKGFSFDYQIEVGGRPGGVFYAGMRVGLPVVRKGLQLEEGHSYKEQRYQKSRLVRFIQSL